MKKNKKNFITEDILNKKLDERFTRFEKYLDHRLQPLEEMAEDFYKFQDFVIDKLDWLMGKYIKFEDEHMILTNRYSSINERLEQLEESH